MEQNSKSNRLHALDGLRGIAILMVFLSHINATYIDRSSLWGSYIFNSGVLGVSFLFILSGFLMAYLYPQPKSGFAFIQKRYTRIFPLFLTLCSTIFALRFIPENHWYFSLGILIIFAIIAHLIWVHGIQRFVKNKFTKILFFAFITFQIVVGIYYLWVMHHPAVYYYQQMPLTTRFLTDWFVNATLTLPIGKYVTPLDPVYWSLAAEVLFYLLYPFICAPIIAYMSPKKRISKIILLVCLLPLFVGLAILAQHVLNLSLLRFQLFYYFVTGMTLGYLYRKYPNALLKIGKVFTGKMSYLTIVLFFGCILFAQLLETAFAGQIIWVQAFLALPFTFLLAIALINKTALAELFRSKILVFIGTISYSIYLSHMFILDLAIDITRQPHSALTTTLYILATLAITISISSILYFLLEKPYFIRKQIEKKVKLASYVQNPYVPMMVGGIGLGFLIVTFMVYQSNINFFTLNEPYKNIITSSAGENQLISLQQHSAVTMLLTAKYNNFGVLSLNLIHKTIPKKKFIQQRIEFRIKEKGADQWLSTSRYTISSKSETLPVSYGFPLIPNSIGKTYVVSLKQEVASSSEYVLLDAKDNTIKGVFFVDKKMLIKDPQKLFAFIENKLTTVIDNPEAQEVVQLSLPFILFTLYLLITNKHLFVNKKYHL